MSLDVNIRLRKKLRCKECGQVVCLAPVYDDVDEVDTGGRVLWEYLDSIGYGDSNYGEYVELTEEQADALAKFSIMNEVYNRREVAYLIETAKTKDYVVELEADW